MASVNANADPFAGGAQQRNLAPPTVGGGIGSANTRVSAPVAGVAPTQIKSARPNEGSNIGIPYSRSCKRLKPLHLARDTPRNRVYAHQPVRAYPKFNFTRRRLVPLNTSNKLFLKNEQGKMEWRTETEDLRATTLAFVLGVRGKQNNKGRKVVDGSAVAPGYAGHNVAYQPNIMPGMPGTERFQQLCSIEYLQMYFAQVLSTQTISLNEDLVTTMNALEASVQSTGPVGAYMTASSYANSVGVPPTGQGNPELDDTTGKNSMLNVEDIAQKNGLADSQAANAPGNYQGIFARDFGPFLKGKGSATQLVNCTVGNNPQTFGQDPTTGFPSVAQPFSISRNAGDDLAFAVLDAKLTEVGCTDWRPDGIVLSKGSNDPSDKMSDEYLEARDGQLYNIRVQGPAIGTSWTGERSLETLPLDKVFVVIVADVWFDDNGDAQAAAEDPSATVEVDNPNDATKKLKVPKYDEMRRKALENNGQPMNEEVFMAKQKASFSGTDAAGNAVPAENTVLCNFRVQVSTSSQMVNHSEYSKRGNAAATQGDYKRPRLDGMSRMGLKLCEDFGEYIVGGWQIGQVLDTSASRASMPGGSLTGVRTAPNSSALSVNVNVSWYTADRLARSFNNPEGTVRTRFDNRRTGPKNPVNMQENTAGYKNGVEAEKAKAAAKAP